ncbi:MULTISPECIES: carbohydrate kinase family protein [Flavobacteriaceae]|uniref:carbohydrate kinase family protein n=1 Tax=Flavobacteriaceae TaxID=49546 RepID=UPI001492E664|nr:MULTISPECIES: carbohydrate kinase family protein [Allomuricauda]MDC6366802.1 carbohydrate kinase family protein [Muricauda sp. AC10]
MKKKFDVLVVGELNVDIILNDIIGFPKVGTEILANEMTVTLGSSSAIFASNLSALGKSVAFAGLIGQDSFSNLIKTSLVRKNVDTSFVISSEKHATGLTMVMNYEMDRANVTFPGAMEHLSANDITNAMLLSAKHLHLSSIFLQKSIKSKVVDLFERAKKLGLSTSMDPQWDPLEKWNLDLGKLLPHIDIFLPNKVEFLNITKSESILAGLEKIQQYANVVVIKDGTQGAHLWQEEKRITKPAFLNESIADCIGAGDSFDAGFIYDFLNGKNLEQCVTTGNIMGAINTTVPGGTTAFTNFEEIQKVADSKFDYKL